MLKDTVKRWFGFPTVADYQKQLIAKLEEIEAEENKVKVAKKAPAKKAPARKAPAKKAPAKKKAT